LQAANGQLVNLQGLKPRLLDREPAHGQTTNCQHADCERAEGDGAHRKRDNGGGRKGFGSNRDISRHEQPPRVVAIFLQKKFKLPFVESEKAVDRSGA
jgi:hypothetical protein